VASGTERCGEPGIDAQRRSLHSMWGRWSMERTFGPPDPRALLPACAQCCGCASRIGSALVPALQVARLLAYARREGKTPRRLALEEVCCKVGRLDLQKFRGAEPERYPCIAVATSDNPAGRPYRVVDGKHRIHRAAADWLMQRARWQSQSERHPAAAVAEAQQQQQLLTCAFIVFSVAELVASGALVLVPPWLLGRTSTSTGTDQLDSGSVDCVAWMRQNAAGLGLPDLSRVDVGAEASSASGGLERREGGADAPDGQAERLYPESREAAAAAERRPLLC
jgi:hypothetical protein